MDSDKLNEIKDKALDWAKDHLQDWSDPEKYTVKGSLALLSGLYFGYTRLYKPYKERIRYQMQGVPFPGWHFPCFGDTVLLNAVGSVQDRDAFNAMVVDHYKGQEIPPIVGSSFQNVCWLFINDCDLYKQIVIDHAKDVDRGDSFAAFQEQMIGGSFITMKTNEEWKEKRKVLAKAFFKEKMIQMTDNIKTLTLRAINEWAEKGEIDVIEEFKILQGNIINASTCGMEYLDKKVKYYHQDGTESEVGMFESVSKLQVELNEKVFHPLRFLFPELQGTNVVPNDYRVDKNLNAIKEAILEILEDHKKRYSQEEISNMGHLASVLLTEECYRKDQRATVNEILTFYMAGSLTVSLSSANMIMYMNQNKHQGYKEQLLKEVDSVMKDKKDLQKDFTIDDLDSFAFLKMVYNEALRHDPPAGEATPYEVKKQFNIGGITVKPGNMELAFLLKRFCFDKKQWVDPEEFRPERFDPKNQKYFLTPSGKQRSPYAFAPFHAGPRVCFGKTFAENTVRITMPLVFHLLDFEIINQEYHNEKPENNTTLMTAPVFKLKVKKRQH